MRHTHATDYGYATAVYPDQGPYPADPHALSPAGKRRLRKFILIALSLVFAAVLGVAVLVGWVGYRVVTSDGAARLANAATDVAIGSASELAKQASPAKPGAEAAPSAHIAGAPPLTASQGAVAGSQRSPGASQASPERSAAAVSEAAPKPAEPSSQAQAAGAFVAVTGAIVAFLETFGEVLDD